jgi:hypothetical protein
MSYKDLITDADGDLIFLNGDIKIDESDTQHVEHILIADKGQFRQFPLIGVGIARYYNGSINKQELKQSVKLQLESDGYNVRQIVVDTTEKLKIDIDADRKNV